MSRPLVRNRDAAIVAGVAMLIGSFVLLHDAFEGRGHDKPLWLRPFTFW